MSQKRMHLWIPETSCRRLKVIAFLEQSSMGRVAEEMIDAEWQELAQEYGSQELEKLERSLPT